MTDAGLLGRHDASVGAPVLLGEPLEDVGACESLRGGLLDRLALLQGGHDADGGGSLTAAAERPQ